MNWKETAVISTVARLSLFVALLLTNGLARCAAAEPELIGHWKLQGDCRDHSGNDNHGVNHGVDLATGSFDGEQSYIEVPSSESLKLGVPDFTICAKIH